MKPPEESLGPPYPFFLRLARWVWPEIVQEPPIYQVPGVSDVVTCAVMLVLSAAGVVWLAAGTDWPALATDWPLLLLLAALYVLLGRIDLFMVVEVDRGRYTDWSGSLNSVVLWTAILITGPAAGWFALADLFYTYLRNRRKDYMPGTRWRRRRNLMINAAVLPLATMCGAGVYTALGGVFPMPGFAPPVLGAALAGILAGFAVETALWLPLLVFLRGLQLRQATGKPALARAWWRFFTLGFLTPNLSLPFALLGAGLYSQDGLSMLLFFMAGLLLVALVANRLSRAAERARQQSRQLELLEQLGRGLLAAPPELTTLPELLQQYAPAMFTYCDVEIRLFPAETLYHGPLPFPPVG
ncbi:MAG: hypothetical protein GYA17_05815, partial [Chloroflexi bacterium]|nr:hypothetical protein [Chloroflexota bacterium]